MAQDHAGGHKAIDDALDKAASLPGFRGAVVVGLEDSARLAGRGAREPAPEVVAGIVGLIGRWAPEVPAQTDPGLTGFGTGEPGPASAVLNAGGEALAVAAAGTTGPAFAVSAARRAVPAEVLRWVAERGAASIMRRAAVPPDRFDFDSWLAEFDSPDPGWGEVH